MLVALVDSTTISIIALLIFAVLLGLVFWYRRIRQIGNREPIIELEKLVNCKSCKSLIPEGANKCAFCGATQRRDGSGE